MLKKVPTVKTFFTQKEFVMGLILAWFDIYQNYPKKEQIAVIYSQWALETGKGNYCWNYNLGNIKAVDSPNQIIEYIALNGVWEIINGKKIIIPPENPGAWFRSFNTLTDGIVFHINFLKNKRYKKAWEAVELGQPAEFSRRLKAAWYYTAPEADYTKLLTSYFNQFMKDKLFESIMEELNSSSKYMPSPPPTEEDILIYVELEKPKDKEENIELSLTTWQKIKQKIFSFSLKKDYK